MPRIALVLGAVAASACADGVPVPGAPGGGVDAPVGVPMSAAQDAGPADAFTGAREEPVFAGEVPAVPGSMSPCGAPGCSAGCLALEGPACDTLEADCQERVLAALACVRPGSETLPPVSVIDTSTFRDLVEEGLAEAREERAEFAEAEWVFGRALALLGLAPAGWDLAEGFVDRQVEGVQAFYRPEDRAITLVERGDGGQSADGMFVLAHELVHAQQDAEVDLQSLLDVSVDETDSAIAVRCWIEGEANLYANQAMLLLSGQRITAEELGQRGMARLPVLVDLARASEDVFAQLQILVPYLAGEAYMTGLWLQRGDARPGSVSELPGVVLGFLGAPGLLPTSGEVLDCALPSAPEGFGERWPDSLGAAGLLALGATTSGADALQVLEDARLWRADRFAGFHAPDLDEVALAWRIRLADTQSALALQQRLGEVGAEAWRVSSRGPEVLLLAADDPASLQAWLEQASGGCVPPGLQESGVEETGAEVTGAGARWGTGGARWAGACASP